MVDLDLFLAEAGVEIVPVTAAQARLAREAHRRFGKGNHPANLNFGDCFAYALAKERDLPLLFKGEDFTRTDLRPAL
jgi:ribonuclease VapC